MSKELRNNNQMEMLMLEYIRTAYHQLHVAAVIIHVLLVFGELLHILPHA
ncbi:hypothetical protein [Ruegeria faecimaris]|nr:hypothetical protein [Ruegeria faecimaris]